MIFMQNDIRFAKPTVELLKLLPSVQCLSPKSVCSMLEKGREGNNNIHYDSLTLHRFDRSDDG